jgi:hypothetical protein
MKVRAKELGVYGGRRWKEGVEFEVDPAKFTTVWMEPLDDEGKALAAKLASKQKVSKTELMRKELEELKAKLKKAEAGQSREPVI